MSAKPGFCWACWMSAAAWEGGGRLGGGCPPTSRGHPASNVTPIAVWSRERGAGSGCDSIFTPVVLEEGAEVRRERCGVSDVVSTNNNTEQGAVSGER